ncbi:MAG: rhodanese-like domain-containing protein [Bacteroidales bacterium]
MRTIKAKELKKWMSENKDFQLIDVRSENEFKEKHIPGALLIPMDQIPNQLKLIEKNKPIVIYCLSGIRSFKTALYLKQELNLEEVYNLKGGIIMWSA